MAQNVKIAGATYENVPAVMVPKADNSGNARFTDTSDATATADKILQGYAAYGANGTKLNGTAQSGGGGTDHDFIVTADLDPNTFVLSNVSATLAEVVSAHEANKDVRFNGIADIQGIGVVVFSAALIQTTNVTVEGFTYQAACFYAELADENDISKIFIIANSEDNNGAFSVINIDEPRSLTLDVVYDDLGYTVNYTGNIGNVVNILLSEYKEKLRITIAESGEDNHGVLQMVNLDKENLTAQYEVIDRGIKYILNINVYDDPNDIPSGTLYYTGVYDEETVYVAFTLNALLADISYVYITSSQQTGNQVDISSVQLPDLFETKRILLFTKQQLANISVVVIFTNLGVSASVPAVMASQSEMTFSNALYNGVQPFLTVYANFVISSSPGSGYYIQLPSGMYLNVNCVSEMNTPT